MIPKSKKRIRLCALLLILNLGFIWGNSLLAGSLSGALSQMVHSLLSFLLPSSGGSGGDGPLRKMAHFAEFCSLGVLLSWLFAMLLRRPWQSAAAALAAGAAAACTDELIQTFIPGRCGCLKDVGIDVTGLCTGILFLYIGYFIYKRTHQDLGGSI